MPGPLDGIRVIDMTRILAGPTATQVLADLGADVIKIERPETGDDVRGWGPPYLEKADGSRTEDSVYFQCANRNKRSVTVNMAHPEGQALLRKLIAEADILFENYKTGTLAKYGLAYEQLKDEFPGLIYCSLTGYGQTGPYAPRAGFDLVVQAMGGIMSITGSEDGEPVKVGVGIADIMTGMYSNIAILSALHHREKTGQGQQIDMALLDCQVAWLVNEGMNYLYTGKVPHAWGTGHATIVPYQAFPAADGEQFILACGTDRQFHAFAKFVGHPEWADDPRYSKNSERVQRRAEVVDMVSAVTRTKPRAYWLEELPKIQVPSGPLNTIDQVFADPQVQARGMQIAMEHPATGKKEPYIASPIKMSETPPAYRRPAPMLGQHNAEVLTQVLGLSDAEVKELTAKGVL